MGAHDAGADAAFLVLEGHCQDAELVPKEYAENDGLLSALVVETVDDRPDVRIFLFKQKSGKVSVHREAVRQLLQGVRVL